MPAFFAGSPRVILPEIEHGLAKVLDDVAAIEIDVFDQRPAVFAIEDDVFVFAGRAAAFDHNAKRIGRPHWSMRDIRRDEKRLTFAH